MMSKLTRGAVLVRALRIADGEGLDGLTIRRLAGEFDVTPMALYWHFKNKEELYSAMADHVLGGVTPDGAADGAWKERLGAMVGALIQAMRAHPCLPDLLHLCDKNSVDGFRRATNTALGLLKEAGFTLAEGSQISSYLLTGAISLVHSEPGTLPGTPPEAVAEVRRRHRLEMESLPADRFPHIVEFAATMEDPPDVERHYSFGFDLLMAGVETMAARGDTT
jgi:AcrR family transcriptional regulator